MFPCEYFEIWNQRSEIPISDATRSWTRKAFQKGFGHQQQYSLSNEGLELYRTWSPATPFEWSTLPPHSLKCPGVCSAASQETRTLANRFALFILGFHTPMPSWAHIGKNPEEWDLFPIQRLGNLLSRGASEPYTSRGNKRYQCSETLEAHLEWTTRISCAVVLWIAAMKCRP